MAKYRKATRSENLFERGFFILWVVSWFAACWVFPLQFFFTGLFAFFLCVIHANAREIQPKTYEERLEELNSFQRKRTKKIVKDYIKCLEKQPKNKRVKKR